MYNANPLETRVYWNFKKRYKKYRLGKFFLERKIKKEEDNLEKNLIKSGKFKVDIDNLYKAQIRKSDVFLKKNFKKRSSKKFILK